MGAALTAEAKEKKDGVVAVARWGGSKEEGEVGEQGDVNQQEQK